MTTRQTSERGDTRPIPDPTALTTEATQRLEVMLRNLINVEIGHQRELFDQKVALVQEQFKMLAERTAEQKKDTSDSLSAALAAAQALTALQNANNTQNIAKSEASTNERIKNIEVVAATNNKAFEDKISDLKDRVARMESTKVGVAEGVGEVRQNVADNRANASDARAGVLYAVTIVSSIVAIGSILFGILKP